MQHDEADYFETTLSLLLKKQSRSSRGCVRLRDAVDLPFWTLTAVGERSPSRGHGPHPSRDGLGKWCYPVA